MRMCMIVKEEPSDAHVWPKGEEASDVHTGA